MNIMEQAFHFWKKPREGEPGINVNYANSGSVRTRHVAWTNVVDNIEILSVNERIMEQKEPGDRLTMVRSEQKSVSVLGHLLGQYTTPEDLVCELFAGSFPVARGSIGFYLPRKCVSVEEDSACVQK